MRQVLRHRQNRLTIFGMDRMNHCIKLVRAASSCLTFQEGDFMVRKTSSWIGTILLLTSLTRYAGGPPILTTSKVPEYFVVGRPETLVFVVRGFCCGRQPLVRKN